MSNAERQSDVIVAGPDQATGPQVMSAREVPLGGLRAMPVRRTLPQRERSLIGAWCFADHYGPVDVDASDAMMVAPHPHTGLQTVTWLFTGEVEHRDSSGGHALVRPGELTLMTSGRGISHSENSTENTRTLQGVQLWLALPDRDRHTDPGLAHHVPAPVVGDGWEARVFLGSLAGDTSPVPTFTPLLGAELVLEAGARLTLDVEPGFEHGVLVDTGTVEVAGLRVARAQLAYVPPGGATLELVAPEGAARVVLLGGEPFQEPIIMWWNFVGRTHEEIVAFRAEWQEQITSGDDLVADAQQVAPGRFGVVVGDHDQPIPAPALPNARLRLRR